LRETILRERGVAKYADRFQRSLTIFGRGGVYQPQKNEEAAKATQDSFNKNRL
jgi:hypothetical protein